jgi:hypothetical protein
MVLIIIMLGQENVALAQNAGARMESRSAQKKQLHDFQKAAGGLVANLHPNGPVRDSLSTSRQARKPPAASA